MIKQPKIRLAIALVAAGLTVSIACTTQPSPGSPAASGANPAAKASPTASLPFVLPEGYTRHDGTASGFEIAYPTGWTVDTSRPNAVTFRSPDGEATFTVTAQNLGGSTRLETVLSNYLKDNGITALAIQPTTVHGQEAQAAPWEGTSPTGEQMEGAAIALNNLPWSYVLAGAVNQKSGEVYDEPFGEILRSFRMGR